MTLPRTLLAWLLLIALLPFSAFAERPFPVQALCQIKGGPGLTGDGPIDYGSGVLLNVNAEQHGLVVTNKHVIEDHPRGPFSVVFVDGKSHAALLVATSKDYDLAALKIGDVDRQPAAWGGKIEGETFHSAGFGDLKNICYKSGNYMGFGRAQNGRQVNVYFTMPIIGGDSGGPIFNSRYEVCAIGWAGMDGEDRRYRVWRGPQVGWEYYHDNTTAVSGACLVEFLGKLGVKPEPVPQQYCYGGNCQPYIIEQPYYPQPQQPQQPDSGAIVPAPKPLPAPISDPIVQAPPAADANGWRAVIEDRIATLEDRAPVPGPTGPQGERGERGAKGETGAAGRDGKDGNDAVVDIDALAVAIAKRNPDWHQLTLDQLAAELQGRLTHSAELTLLDGTRKPQTKPLNEPLEFIQHSRGLK